MRAALPFGVLLALALAGCGGDEAPPPAPGGPAPTHEVAFETVYYLADPDPHRPPDGLLEAGRRVAWIRDEGPFALVAGEDGLVAWTAGSALVPLDD